MKEQRSTVVRICADCPTELQRKGIRGSWPDRCPPCSAARDCSIRAKRERQRVRASRAKDPEPPRECADCPTLIYKAKTKWPERCPRCAKDRINAARNAKKKAEAEVRLAAHHEEPCVDCGGEAEPTSRVMQKPRCTECKRLRLNARVVERRAADPEMFKAAEARWREKNPDLLRQNVQRRRALRASVESESFANEGIFVRDGWICQLCWRPVERDLIWPDRGYPTLDHIVPLTFGGPHIRLNTRLAHYSCNSRRGHRISDDELARLWVGLEEARAAELMFAA